MGGEESGGYAFRGNVPERDGILGNLYMLDFMVKTGKKPSELLALSRKRLLPLIVSHPELVLQMMAALCDRARWLAETYEDSAFLDLSTRLAKRLLFLSRTFGIDTPHGRRLAVSLPHRELAAHMNVTRESISRLVKELERDGLLEERRGIMVLKDLPRLETMAQGSA